MNSSSPHLGINCSSIYLVLTKFCLGLLCPAKNVLLTQATSLFPNCPSCFRSYPNSLVATNSHSWSFYNIVLITSLPSSDFPITRFAPSTWLTHLLSPDTLAPLLFLLPLPLLMAPPRRWRPHLSCPLTSCREALPDDLLPNSNSFLTLISFSS